MYFSMIKWGSEKCIHHSILRSKHWPQPKNVCVSKCVCVYVWEREGKHGDKYERKHTRLQTDYWWCWEEGCAGVGKKKWAEMYDMITFMMRKLTKNLLQHWLGYNVTGMSIHPLHSPHSQTTSQSFGIFLSICAITSIQQKYHNLLFCAFVTVQLKCFPLTVTPHFVKLNVWIPLFKLGYGLTHTQVCTYT